MNKHVTELTTENWEREVLSAEGPVLVDFWASWCAPCRMIGPAIEALAEEFAGRARVGKLNVDDHPEVAARYDIRSIPALMVFRGGKVAEQRLGAAPQAELKRFLEAHTGAGVSAAG